MLILTYGEGAESEPKRADALPRQPHFLCGHRLSSLYRRKILAGKFPFSKYSRGVRGSANPRLASQNRRALNDRPPGVGRRSIAASRRGATIPPPLSG